MKKFIDFDRRNEILFDNFYLEDHKIVVKIPIIYKEDIKKIIKKDMKIEKFNLSKYSFLVNY